MEDNIVLKMRNIHKIFPGVRALQGVDFTLRKGEIHALMGENGAGKSTLINALAPEAGMETGSISRKIERGRHTTRHSEISTMRR